MFGAREYQQWGWRQRVRGASAGLGDPKIGRTRQTQTNEKKRPKSQINPFNKSQISQEITGHTSQVSPNPQLTQSFVLAKRNKKSKLNLKF